MIMSRSTANSILTWHAMPGHFSPLPLHHFCVSLFQLGGIFPLEFTFRNHTVFRIIRALYFHTTMSASSLIQHKNLFIALIVQVKKILTICSFKSSFQPVLQVYSLFSDARACVHHVCAISRCTSSAFRASGLHRLLQVNQAFISFIYCIHEKAYVVKLQNVEKRSIRGKIHYNHELCAFQVSIDLPDWVIGTCYSLHPIRESFSRNLLHFHLNFSGPTRHHPLHSRLSRGTLPDVWLRKKTIS